MIVFDLDCAEGHRFEAWFRNHDEFAEQQDAGVITCPECGSPEVRKALSAPHISQGTRKAEAPPLAPGSDGPMSQAMGAPNLPPELARELDTVFAKVRRYVEANCDYVGERFAEEARRIHYGEVPRRGIYGEATPDETADLLDEGIEVMPLPGCRAKTDA
ncbi:MAG: DUF1178 family protein [Alphaproteobacteria bacterium]|nr:MAG: DUF1178 family protein [Alphaproteobacteria bacterium]